ncbi:hypothetical protein N8261_04245 [Flavobacteriaceae bacterium]|nr:hypothetical protein [Paracoccaceae bacterium]MDA9284692.1 hypothetical protein [Flavobacteriaceae bacterium]MDC1321151.1 hypothetical protein [Flavobacteriaceae bacterium]
MKDHTLVLSESKIIISGLSLVLKQNSIIPVVKSGTIPGYELTLDMDEIYVDDKDLEKAKKHIEKYIKQINKNR